MTDDQIVAFWGPERLVRWPWDVLSPTRLPQRSKHYLSEVGLPRDADEVFQFEATTDDMPRLSDSPSYCVIGYDYVAPICLDEKRNGNVVCVMPEKADGEASKIPERYVNKSVVEFGECLVLYQQYRDSVENLSETAAQVVVAKTEQAIRACDLSALDDPENFWSTVIEQMKLGQL